MSWIVPGDARTRVLPFRRVIDRQNSEPAREGARDKLQKQKQENDNDIGEQTQRGLSFSLRSFLKIDKSKK